MNAPLVRCATAVASTVALAGVVLIGALAACGAPAALPPTDASYEAITAWQGDADVLRVATGRPDATVAGLQVVGVDDAGRVVLVRFEGRTPRATVLHRHGARLIGLAVADVDPAVPGEEIYAGGFLEPGGSGEEKGRGGVVFQIVVTPGGATVREIARSAAFVHALAAVGPAVSGGPARLLVADYAGVARVLTPVAEGAWPATTVHEEPASVGVEDRKVKEALVLAEGGGPRQRALLLMKGGRCVLVDVDAPGKGVTVREEEGGLSRACDDGANGAYVCGYGGRVVHLARDGDTVRPVVLWTDPDKELRGVARGRFPLAGGGAGTLAVYGYGRACRVLAPRGAAWDATTIFRDADKGHGLVAADLFPGDDADELVLASYADRIVVLARRAP